MHAAFDFVDYGRIKSPRQHIDNEYVTFLGIGDIQLFCDMKHRVTNSLKVVNNINKFMDTTYKTLPGRNGEIMGLVNPGDCTQQGRDGRLFMHNELGVYETHYGLGGNSILKIPVYECNGNHDYDVYKDAKFWFPGKTPTVQMINRKNKLRSIQEQDKKGNYRWEWDGVHFIALNVWPSHQKLLNGVPDGSLDFLQRTLQNITWGTKFFILTHYVPNTMGWGDDFNPSDTFKGTPCEPLLDILKLRKDDLVAILIGHIHLDYTWMRINKDDIQIVLLPSPTVNTRGVFAMLRYHKEKNELIVTEVDTNDDGVFTVEDVKLDRGHGVDSLLAT
jgi:hypothetical protein